MSPSICQESTASPMAPGQTWLFLRPASELLPHQPRAATPLLGGLPAPEQTGPLGRKRTPAVPELRRAPSLRLRPFPCL